MANPFNHFSEGWDQAQGMQDQFSRARAGNMLARGDNTGATNALFKGGMINEGFGLQDRAYRAEEQQYQRADRAKERERDDRKEKLGFFKQAATVLSQIPDTDGRQSDRRKALAQLSPTFQAMGLPPEAVQQLAAADLSDNALRLFMGELEKAEQEYTLAPGSARYKGAAKIAEQPFAPEYRAVGEGQSIVEIPRSPGGLAPMGGGIQEGVQALVGMGAQVTSNQRTPERNAAVGGVKGSYHLSGQAYDLVPSGGMTMAQLEAEARRRIPGADIINEGDHVHIEPGRGGSGGARVVAQGPPKSEDPMRVLQAQNLQGQIDERAEKANAKTQAIAKGAEGRAAKARLVISTVDSALGKVSRGTAGFVGGNIAGIKGTPAYDLAQQVETIKANLGFAELQAMRDASPTGGALGQVAVQELIALQSTVANLDTGQSPDQLRQNLRQIKSHYQKWLNTVDEAGGGAAPAASGAPKRGEVRKGYRFKGGDPSKPTSWEKV